MMAVLSELHRAVLFKHVPCLDSESSKCSSQPLPKPVALAEDMGLMDASEILNCIEDLQLHPVPFKPECGGRKHGHIWKFAMERLSARVSLQGVGDQRWLEFPSNHEQRGADSAAHQCSDKTGHKSQEQAGVLPKITMPAGSQNRLTVARGSMRMMRVSLLQLFPASLCVRQGKGFATWMERCEALLEEQDEANYLAKKQQLGCL